MLSLTVSRCWQAHITALSVKLSRFKNVQNSETYEEDIISFILK
jgi:hypothetical protein